MAALSTAPAEAGWQGVKLVFTFSENKLPLSSNWI
jgi:hypothetical protein